MKKTLIALLLLLSAVTFAHNADKVILVSDTTSVDLLIAKAAAEKMGVPVFVLQNGMLDEHTRDELVHASAKTVYLVGGPVVIKPEVETELSAKYTVVRLWGYERTGTAVAVARHFWSEGAPCAVIADDTKSSEADTEVQAEASESASAQGCPFFPVPTGTVPAEVLDAIGSLNTTNATFVGKTQNPEFKSKLAKLALREITGDAAKIERDIEADIKATKLLVIAAPNWRHVLGHGGHAGGRTLVRILASADSVPSLVELIKARNITDVRVLGEPTLSEQIAAQFNASGIVVTKISGENAADVSRKAFNRTGENWEEKRKGANQDENQMRPRIKASLLERLTDMENKLNSMESELADQSANGAEPARVAELAAKIDAAQNQIAAIKTFVDNSNFDTARIRIDKILGELESLRWTHRGALKVRADANVQEEEASVAEVGNTDELAGLESRLSALKEKCGSDAVANLVQKARSLKQDYDAAVAEGDHVKAARLAVEIRSLIKQAHQLDNVCERLENIDDKLETGARERVAKAEVVKARIVARPLAIKARTTANVDATAETP